MGCLSGIALTPAIAAVAVMVPIIVAIAAMISVAPAVTIIAPLVPDTSIVPIAILVRESDISIIDGYRSALAVVATVSSVSVRHAAQRQRR